MERINWDEFKAYKAARDDAAQMDNFQVLLEFIRSFYNVTSYYDIYDMLAADELSQMMLEKREITEPEQLSDYLYKQLSR